MSWLARSPLHSRETGSTWEKRIPSIVLSVLLLVMTACGGESDGPDAAELVRTNSEAALEASPSSPPRGNTTSTRTATATQSPIPTASPTPTPSPAPTPVSVSAPTFVTNELRVGCHEAPRADSRIVAEREIGGPSHG